jgi:hypothetical protein
MPAGSLRLFRWHSQACPHRAKGRRWTRCNCAVWVQGSLGGQWVKRALGTREWPAAAATIHGWEASGEIGVIKVVAPTIEDAVGLYFQDAEARHLAKTTLQKRRELLEGKLLSFCKDQGLSHLAARRRDVADVSQRLALLRPVRGQATGVLAVVPALLSGLRLDRAQRRASPEAA